MRAPPPGENPALMGPWNDVMPGTLVMLPGRCVQVAPPVGGFQNARAVVTRAAEGLLAGAHVDGLARPGRAARRVNGDGPDGQGHFAVSQRRPVDAAVGGLPHPAEGPAGVSDVRIGGVRGQGADASGGESKRAAAGGLRSDGRPHHLRGHDGFHVARGGSLAFGAAHLFQPGHGPSTGAGGDVLARIGALLVEPRFALARVFAAVARPRRRRLSRARRGLSLVGGLGLRRRRLCGPRLLRKRRNREDQQKTRAQQPMPCPEMPALVFTHGPPTVDAVIVVAM
jgi:hypothetical protein